MKCNHYYTEGLEVIGYKIENGNIYTVVLCLVCGKEMLF